MWLLIFIGIREGILDLFLDRFISHGGRELACLNMLHKSVQFCPAECQVPVFAGSEFDYFSLQHLLKPEPKRSAPPRTSAYITRGTPRGESVVGP
jgi:hypothetical protein